MNRIDGNDVLIVSGLGLLGYGLYLIWPPLMPLVTGGLLLFIGLLGAFRKGADK